MAMSSTWYQSLCQIRHLNMSTSESMLQKQTVLKCIYIECAESSRSMPRHEKIMRTEYTLNQYRLKRMILPPRMVQMQMVTVGLKKNQEMTDTDMQPCACPWVFCNGTLTMQSRRGMENASFAVGSLPCSSTQLSIITSMRWELCIYRHHGNAHSKRS